MANDLISRNALLRSLNDHAPKPTTDDLYEVNLCIINAPAVDASPVVHGRFVGTEYDGYADGNPVYYEWQCSECGCVFEDDEPTYNYCPNCGAKMDGGDT